MRNVLLTAHIAFAIVVIGWLAVQGLVTPGLIRKGNAAAVRWIADISKKAGPASVVVLLLGLWLALRDSKDLLDLSDTWLSAAIGIFVVTAVLGGAVGGKAEERAAEKLAAGQPADAEARRLQIVGVVNVVLLVVIVWLMVDKPGLL